MLAKQYKLTWKDINFLFKKQKVVYWKYFCFFHFQQYSNRHFNQFAIQVPVKLTKKATTRNIVKRSFFEYIRKNSMFKDTFWWYYYKIFVVFNKKYVSSLKNSIETMEKKLINSEIVNNFEFSFNNFRKQKWKNL